MDSKERRLERIKRKLNIRGDLRIKELKARYYGLALSIEFPVELDELKSQLASGELSYSGFTRESDRLLMQDTNYVELKQVRDDILRLDPTFFKPLEMTESQAKRFFSNRLEEIEDRLIENEKEGI